MRYYLDKAGRPRNPDNHRSLRGAEVDADPDAIRVMHPRDARLLHLSPDDPWTPEAQGRADLVRAGLEEPPPAPEKPAEIETSTSPEPELLPEPEPEGFTEGVDVHPYPDEGAAPAPEAPDALQTTPEHAPEPVLEHAPEKAADYPEVEVFEEDEAGEPSPDDAPPEPDPDCPCCASEVRTCARGHTYAPVSESEARALVYMADGAVCAIKHRRSGEPQIPLLAMTSAEACAAMGMPHGSHEAAEALISSARIVMQKRGAFFAEYADILGLLGSAMMVSQNRASAKIARAEAPPTEPSE